ncbi:MAG: RagB/SusD family nutrient uptake outer membrane protein [Bacteroidota bacterium]|nr:RagB/SusD family nutrient uptake outer membrane protein [Bacteroidota bacterium]
MKEIRYKSLLAVTCFIMLLLSACEKDFLQMPISSSTTIDSVFSTTTKAQSAIASAYQKILSQGLPYQGNWNAMLSANLSGELNYGFSWTISRNMIINGYTASGNSEDMDGFNTNYTMLRQAYLVKENIAKVHDMSDADKSVVRAEMQALIAYRYTQMLIEFGGVPIVTKSLLPTDDLAIPRNSVKEVLDSIVNWCDQSVKVLPSSWPATWHGRMTKSAALAIKAKALLYAARPLFNSATPYLDFGNHNNLICLGNYDSKRWDAAAAANDAVISEAETNGGFQLINTGNPLDDYGTATSTPDNAEVLLAFKCDNSWQMNMFYNMHNWQAYGNLLTTNFLENYYKNDGTDQVWPNTTTVTNFSDYVTKMNQMEARFKASFQAWQIDAWNNPGDNYWSAQKMFQWSCQGAAEVTKFYYKAGTRSWFEFPVFRLAAAYLGAAEAYNEMGGAQNTQLALTRLNKIHQRAGLPAITETDQTKLRALIQREWAVEFFDENYRLHDVKHWMLANIGNGIIGGPIRGFNYNNGKGSYVTNNVNYYDFVLYQGFWAPKEYLNPFPQSEINKGILIQNPGY